jgi:hypothetical protein
LINIKAKNGPKVGQKWVKNRQKMGQKMSQKMGQKRAKKGPKKGQKRALALALAPGKTLLFGRLSGIQFFILPAMPLDSVGSRIPSAK